MFGDWLLGVCGGYEGEELEHCGHVFSDMEKYEEQTAVEKSIEMVERIRAYWMREADKYMVQKLFEKNLKYISESEVDVETIERQFVRTESRYYLQVGKIDCPTGKIVVSDPLCYLAAGKLCPQLVLNVAPGTYPVEVSICRHPLTDVRANPNTGNRLVMIASGFGDGFYQSFWGYDDAGEVCELIVPMVNPDLVDELE